MKITYFIGAKGNPLYDGDFFDRGAYKTFGQHSFIYDLVINIANQGILIDVLVDDIDSFPLTAIFVERGICVSNLVYKEIVSADVILLDNITSEILLNVSLKGITVGLIHNHLVKCSRLFYKRSKFILCLTEFAKDAQSAFVEKEKIVVIKQGIDLERFSPKAFSPKSPKVLVYSRMDKHKGSIYIPIIEKLIRNDISVSVLGEGVNYRLMKNIFPKQIKFYQHRPCYKIHRFIKHYDVIISNGRGVMEGLATGKITIAAGVQYGGIVDNDNVDFLFERNFTGSNLKNSKIQIVEDIEKGFNFSSSYFRAIAEKLFDVKDFIKSLLDVISK